MTPLVIRILVSLVAVATVGTLVALGVLPPAALMTLVGGLVLPSPVMAESAPKTGGAP